MKKETILIILIVLLGLGTGYCVGYIHGNYKCYKASQTFISK